ncbi:MAG: hypothetical protein ACTHJX_06970 [Terriglobales bacterium]
MRPATLWCASVAAAFLACWGAAASGRPGPHFQLVKLQPLSFPTAAEVPLRNSSHSTDLPTSRLSFSQPEVLVTVEYSPPGWPEGSLVIAGLNHPELQMRTGAHLDLLLINQSQAGTIMLGVTEHGPPFAHQPILPNPWDRSFRQRASGQGGWSHAVLPRRGGKTVYAARIEYRVSGTGTAYYVNDVEDAANAGEFGLITVIP